MPRAIREVGDRHAEIDARPCSLASLLELSARQEKEGQGDAPWPPQYKKQPGEPTRVQPSRRRVPKHPLIEMAARGKKEEALAGLERWRARHPEAAAHLEPADVLVDSMRGRFSTWTRIRVNLQHVPGAATAQEALDPDDSRDWKRQRWRRAKDLLELVRSGNLELIVAAIRWQLVRAPALKDRRMPKTIALQVIVFDLADSLDPQRLPRQIFSRAPAALTARHACHARGHQSAHSRQG